MNMSLRLLICYYNEDHVSEQDTKMARIERDLLGSI